MQFFRVLCKTGDQRSSDLAKSVKYGTTDATEILMLRCGLSFEDIDFFKPYIKTVSEEEIVFYSKIEELCDIQRAPIERYLSLQQ